MSALSEMNIVKSLFNSNPSTVFEILNNGKLNSLSSVEINKIVQKLVNMRVLVQIKQYPVFKYYKK